MNEGDFSIEFEVRESYIYAYVTGTDSFETCLNSWARVAKKAGELGIPRVLVHECLMGHITEGELFNVLQKVIPMGIGIKVAFFNENQDHEAFFALGELMARNRGIDIQMFQSLEDAEKWISD